MVRGPTLVGRDSRRGRYTEDPMGEPWYIRYSITTVIVEEKI